MRAREAAIWEMEERQLHERHQLAKRQLKDLFFLQRHQMLVRILNYNSKQGFLPTWRSIVAKKESNGAFTPPSRTC